METVIEAQVQYNHKLYEAIHLMKKEVKELSLTQRTTKKAFRESMAVWSKTPLDQHSYTDKLPQFNDSSSILTSMFIIYGMIRGKAHLSNEAMEKYFQPKSNNWIYFNRRNQFNLALTAFLKDYPELAYLLDEKKVYS
jgi:hypothetical protein